MSDELTEAARSESRIVLKAVLKSAEYGAKVLMEKKKTLDRLVAELANDISICQRLMAIPGVGPVTVLNFFSGVDDPKRFKSSRVVAAYFVLTPRVFQSGPSIRSGRISHRGD